MNTNKTGNFLRENGFIIALVALIVINVFVRGSNTSNPISDFWGWLEGILVIIPGIIIGLTVHEFAHAFVAYKLGDMTPMYHKRVTLNPLRHIDPIGLIALFLIRFGWGKPVPVNPYAFKHPRRDNLLVDIAGIVTNFIVAIIFAGIIVLFDSQVETLFNNGLSGTAIHYIYMVLDGVIWINLVLMVFNLLPIPPLDGFGIVTEIFNLRGTKIYQTIYNMGFPILIVLIILNVPSRIIGPIISTLYEFVIDIFLFFV